MEARTIARLAWPLWSATVVLLGSGLAFAPGDGEGASGVTVIIATIVFVLSFATVGALIMKRRSHNPIGWLMACAALCYGLGAVTEAIIAHSRSLSGPQPGAALADQVGGWVWTVGLGLGGIFVLLLFPDGHPPSRRWRPVTWAAGAALAMFVIGSVIAPGPSNGPLATDNPTGIPAAAGPADALKVVGVALLVLCMLGAVASLITRWRGSEAEQRQQLKWLAYAAMVVVAGAFASGVIESLGRGSEAAIDLANASVTFALAAIPIAAGVAILRYHLYDIDRIINRTLVYASLTAVLGLVYVAGVVGLGSVIRGATPGAESNNVVVAASTLAVAALFRPARARIQGFIDRRFYRRRYDAARTVEAFAARLRDEVALDALKSDLLTVVRDTVHPTHVSIWLRDGTGGGAESEMRV